MWTREETKCVFYASSFKASCPYGRLSVYIRKGKRPAESIKQYQQNTRVSQSRTIYPGKCKKTQQQPRAKFIAWSSYCSKDLGVVIVRCHLPLKCFFFLFAVTCLISLNVKHLLLKKPNPSDDFSTPLKWKWCIWQNSGINIIKEFNLQKPQHLLAWREYWITFLWIQLMDLMALRQPFISQCLRRGQ